MKSIRVTPYIILSVAVFVAVFSGISFAEEAAVPASNELPVVSDVLGAQVNIDQANNSMTITALDPSSVLNFSSFNIGSNASVNIVMPTSDSTMLNRVTGSSASSIFGSINANQGLWVLVNTNGIYFAPTAVVNVDNMIASTLDISTNNFLAGNYIFEHQGTSYAQLLNEGKITGNNIALMGSAVENTGIIVARAGSVHLSSGDKTTVSFDRRGLISIEVNEQTSGEVLDLNGNKVEDALSNSGNIQGVTVVMTAQTANNIFKNAVNLSGIIKATQVVEEEGVIRIVSNKNINVSAEFKTEGNTILSANEDINVNGDLTVENGNLDLLADSDLDGIGSFYQAQNTTISTINYGDITIQASGASTLANINSAGNLILKQGGLPVTFTQYTDSLITTQDSLVINSGVILNAANSNYNIGKDWINEGVFNPQISKVSLTSSQDALVQGSNVFYNFSITEPGKIVKFESESTQAILNNLTFRGEYGNLLTITSIDPSKQFSINPLGQTDIQYSLISNLNNIRGPPLKALHTSSLGNNTNLDLDPFWTGNGPTSNWSDPDNWDTGTIPTAFDTVTFDGITGSNPNKDSFIDTAFQGSIDNLTLNGYTGILTLQRDLTISGNLSIQTGTFNTSTYTVTFTDSSKPSYLSGDIAFYNFICNTPDKELYFQAGKTYTFTNSLTITGAPDQGVEEYYVKLRSQTPGSQYSLNVQSTYSLERVNVSDAYAVTALDIPIGVNAGNNTNITIDPTWDNGAGTGLWSNATNWSGNTLPTGTDAVTFDATSTANCSIDNLGSWSGGSVTIAGTYSGIITLNTATMTAGAFSIAGGTFNSNGNTLNVSSYTQTGGTFTAGSSTITCSGSWSHTAGTFNYNTSTVDLTGTGNLQTPGTQYTVYFYDLNLAANTKTTTMLSHAGTAGTLTLGGGTLTDGASSYTFSLIPDNSGDVAARATTASTVTISQFIFMSRSLSAGENMLIGPGDFGSQEMLFFSETDNITYKLGGAVTTSGLLVLESSPANSSMVFDTNSTGNHSLTVGGLEIGHSWANSTITINFNGSSVDIGSTGLYVYANGGSHNLNLGSSTVTNAGPWTLSNGTGSITQNAGTSTVTFDGTVALTSNGQSFNNIAIGSDSAGASVTLQDAASIDGNLTVANGGATTLNLNGKTLTFSGGAFNLTNLDTFTVTSSTVTFDATTTLTGAGKSFNNVTINSSGTVTLGGALDVNGLLTITAGTLDVSASNYQINVAGGWTDTGAGTFTERSGTVVFDGTGTINSNEAFYVINTATTGSQTLTLGNNLQVTSSLWISTGTFNANGYDVTDSGSFGLDGGTYQASTGATTVSGNFYIYSWYSTATFTGSSGAVSITGDASIYNTNNGQALGTFTAPTSLTVAGTWTKGAYGTFTHNSGTVTFTGASKTIDSGGASFNNVAINDGASISLLTNNLTCAGTLTVGQGTSGSLNLNSKNLTVTGAFTVANGATLYLVGTETITGTPILNSGSTVEYNPTSAGSPTIKAWTYTNAILTINAADNTVWISPSGDITCATFNLSVGNVTTYTGNSITVSGTTTISSGTQLYLQSTFNANTLNNSGTITFDSSVGFDAIISLDNGATLTNSGIISIGDATNTITIQADAGGTAIFSGTDIDYNGRAITLSRLTYNPAVALGASESITLGGNVTFASTVTLNGAGAALTTGSNNMTLSATGTPLVVTNGTFTNTGGTVTYTGSGTTTNIATVIYNNLILTPTSATTYNLTGNLTSSNALTGNLTINSNATLDLRPSTTDYSITAVNITINGTLDAASSSATITASGNWDSSSGTFTYGTSTVILSGTGNLSTPGTNYTIYFHDLTLAASGQTTTMLTHAGIDGTLTLGGGTLTDGASSYSFNMYPSNGDVAFTTTSNSSVDVSQFFVSDSGLNGNGQTILIGPANLGAQNILLMPGNYSNTILKMNGAITTTGLLDLRMAPFSYAGATNFSFDTDISNNYALTVGGFAVGDSWSTNSLTAYFRGSVVDIGTSGLYVRSNSGSHTLNFNSATITNAGPWTLSSGTATITQDPGTSIVTLDGTTDQTITTNNQTFNILTLNNTGASGSDDIIISGALNVNGLLTITNGDLDVSTNDPAVNLAGGMTVGANGSIDLTAYSGTWTYISSGTLTDSRSTLGDLGTFTIEDSSGNATLTLGSNIKATSITITTAEYAELNLGVGSYTLELTGSGTPLTNNGTFNKGTGSTVKYSGTSATNIATVAYNNLQLSGATTYSLTGNLTGANAMTGNLTIDNGATLDTTLANSYGITLAGNWANSGTFIARSSTVTLNGTTDQTITTNNQAFNILTLNNTGAGGSDDIIISGTLDVNGLLTITNGDLDVSTNDPAVNLAGGMTVGANGSIDLTAYSGTWTYDGSGTLTDSRSTIGNLGTFVVGTYDSGTTVTLGSNIKATSITITEFYDTANILNLGTGSYTLELTGSGSPLSLGSPAPGDLSGTFNKGTGSTVKYSGTSATNITTVAYNNLQLSGATTYSLTGNLTSSNALSGNLTIDNGATLDTTAANDYGITLAGNWSNSGTFTANDSTVTFNGTTQSIAGSATTTFNNLTTSGSTNTSTGVATNIAGNLSVGDGTTFTAAGYTLAVTGTTTVGGGASGNLTVSSATGTKTFTGLVTINAGGAWNNSGNSAITFQGGITNSGTFTAGSGIQTFDTNSQALTGTFSIPSITVTGVTLTNNNTLTITTALAGTGGLTNAATGTLNLNFTGTPGITTLTATSSGNTVNYGFAGTQTVKPVSYHHLTLSNSGAKTMASVTTIAGDLTISGSATMTDNAALTVTGALNYSSSGSTTLTASTPISIGTLNHTAGTLIDNGNTITVTGTGASTWVESATFTPTGTVIFTGASPQIGASNFNNLTINVGGGNTATLAGAATIAGNLNISSGTLDANGKAMNIAGNWANSGTFTPNSNTVTFDGAGTSILSGSTTFYNFTSATAGKTLTFTNGTTQTITNALTLTGTAGSPIIINNTGAGAIPKLTLNSGATQSINNVNITNNDASSGLQLVARGTSTLSGTTTNWVLGSTGTTYTWTGSVSTDWNTPGNWDLGVVPSTTDTVVIPANPTRQPTLAAATTVVSLTINSGDTLSTGNNALTITSNLTLNGTLNAGTSTVTVNGNFTAGSNGTIQGTTLGVYVEGFIGTQGNPLNTNVTGTLTLSAEGMQDNVSISVKGTGIYVFQGAIPGFIIVDNHYTNLGQSTIRGSLEQGTSNLYMPRFTQPMAMPLVGMSMLPMPMGFGAMPMPLPAVMPAPAIMPIAVPIAAPIAVPQVISVPVVEPKPSFEGTTSEDLLPAVLSFEGTASTSSLPTITTSREFLGAGAQSTLPRVTTEEAFRGNIAESNLPELLFKGITTFGNLPVSITPSEFRGSSSGSSLPEPLFKGITTLANLVVPVTLREFKGTTAQTNLPQPIVPPKFEGITPTSSLPTVTSPEAFTGANTYAILPEVATQATFIGNTAQAILPEPLFKGITTSANLVVPVTLKEFKGITVQANLPQPIVPPKFEGITPTSSLPTVTSPEEFIGAGSRTTLPEVATQQTFAGNTAQANLPEPLFKGITTSANLVVPVTLKEFKGTTVQANLPQPIVPPKFEGITPNVKIPTMQPLIIQDIIEGNKIELMFPGGKSLVPTYGAGIPFGVEGPVMETKIRLEKEE